MIDIIVLIVLINYVNVKNDKKRWFDRLIYVYEYIRIWEIKFKVKCIYKLFI